MLGVEDVDNEELTGFSCHSVAFQHAYYLLRCRMPRCAQKHNEENTPPSVHVQYDCRQVQPHVHRGEFPDRTATFDSQNPCL